jgi:hypothetical protein
MEHSDKTLLEMARDAYVAGIQCLADGDFEALGQVMAVRDDVLSELDRRFDDRMVSQGCNRLLAEVQSAEAEFVSTLNETMTQLQHGIEQRRRNQSKVKKYAG